MAKLLLILQVFIYAITTSHIFSLGYAKRRNDFC